MKISDYFAIGGNALTYVLSVTQANEILQIVSFVFSIITSCLIVGLKLWGWWKEAKKDGKITKEEIDEAIDIVDDFKKGQK